MSGIPIRGKHRVVGTTTGEVGVVSVRIGCGTCQRFEMIAGDRQMGQWLPPLCQYCVQQVLWTICPQTKRQHNCIGSTGWRQIWHSASSRAVAGGGGPGGSWFARVVRGEGPANGARVSKDSRNLIQAGKVLDRCQNLSTSTGMSCGNK